MSATSRGTLIDPSKSEHDAFDYGDRPSKSQKKRDSTAAQDLGAKVAELSRDKIESLGLPEKLQDALIETSRITAHEGKRRHLQLIGKLMRNVDLDPIRAALEKFSGTSKQEIADMHLAERWRERLLKDADAIALFANDYRDADLQQLRTMIRNAQKEQSQGKPPRDFRKIYQFLRDAIDARRTASTNGSGPTPEDESA
jgi:ribosome-associated protein